FALRAVARIFAGLRAAFGHFPGIAGERKPPLADQMHAAVGVDGQHAHGKPAYADDTVITLRAVGAYHVVFVDPEPIVLKGVLDTLDDPRIAAFIPRITHPICLPLGARERHGDNMPLPLSAIPTSPHENEPANAAHESAETLALLARRRSTKL